MNNDVQSDEELCLEFIEVFKEMYSKMNPVLFYQSQKFSWIDRFGKGYNVMLVIEEDDE